MKVSLKVLLIFVCGALLATGSALAASGDVIRVGSLASPATFVDENTGVSYQLFFEAIENNGGSGATTIVLGGFSRACSVHGPSPVVNPGSDFAYGGNTPLVEVGCGTAYSQSVSINRCIATVEAHGFMHSDHPNVNYLGMTTIEVKYRKLTHGDKIELLLHTPKETVRLSGNVTGGGVTMTSCP
jgi:hypothetical protein